MDDNNLLDKEFWLNQEIQNSKFQDNCLLYITSEYNTTIYNRLFYCIFSFSDEAYI